MKYFILIFILYSCGSATSYRLPNVIIDESINNLDDSNKKQGLWEANLSDIVKYRKTQGQVDYKCLVPYRNDRIIFKIGLNFNQSSLKTTIIPEMSKDEKYFTGTIRINSSKMDFVNIATFKNGILKSFKSEHDEGSEIVHYILDYKSKGSFEMIKIYDRKTNKTEYTCFKVYDLWHRKNVMDDTLLVEEIKDLVFN